jgi:hypothetical protein
MLESSLGHENLENHPLIPQTTSFSYKRKDSRISDGNALNNNILLILLSVVVFFFVALPVLFLSPALGALIWLIAICHVRLGSDWKEE